MSLNAIKAQGRNGDDTLAHLTTGEVVVPKEFWDLDPELMQAIMSRIAETGADPSEVIAGAGRTNPETGLEEFATAEEIQNYYQTYLGRPVESQAMLDWQVNATQGMTPEQAISGFINAPERANLVTNYYNTYLGRAPESTDVVNYHTGSGLSAADLAKGFQTSAERQLQESMGIINAGENYNWSGSPLIDSQLNSIYQGSFGRPAESAGSDYWMKASQGLSGDDYMTRVIRMNAKGDDLLALKDPTLPAYGIERYNTAWDPNIDVNSSKFHYDSALDKWVLDKVKTPVKPPVTVITPQGSTPDTYTPGAWTGSPNNAAPISTFGNDWNTPFSGANWRGTILAGTGMQGVNAYNYIKANSTGGDTLSSLQSKLNLNPGEVMAVYEEALKYAQANNLPIPLMPAVTGVNKPFYNYGFNPAQKLFSRNLDGQSVVNPIPAYLAQIYAQRAATETPTTDEETVKAAEGGYMDGGLSRIQADPVIKRYMRGGSGGQDDDIDAKLSPCEYVMDADVVAALGDGNPEAGAAKLDQMRMNIRKHKRSAPANKIPPKAKAPEQYLKGK